MFSGEVVCRACEFGIVLLNLLRSDAEKASRSKKDKHEKVKWMDVLYAFQVGFR